MGELRKMVREVMTEAGGEAFKPQPYVFDDHDEGESAGTADRDVPREEVSRRWPEAVGSLASHIADLGEYGDLGPDGLPPGKFMLQDVWTAAGTLSGVMEVEPGLLLAFQGEDPENPDWAAGMWAWSDDGAWDSIE